MNSRRLAVAIALAAFAPLATGCMAATDEDELEVEQADESVDLLKAPPAGGMSFARSTKEKTKSVPINGKWKVIYSVALEDLTPDEKISVRGEVQMTTCQKSDLPDTPCKRITPFDPHYKTRVILGTSPTDASGTALTPERDETCSHFKHHCALALPEGVKSGLKGTRFVNLVVRVDGGGNSGNDLMIVDDTHGHVTVTRMAKGSDVQGQKVQAKQLKTGWMGLNMENKEPRQPRTIFQAEIKNAKPGEIIDADAVIEAITDGNGGKPSGCQGAREPLLSHQIFVSKNKDPFAKGSKIGELTEKNGQNCDLDDTCTYHKSGAAQLDKGVSGTVYVSLVSWGGRSCSAPKDQWKLGGKSELKVRRRD